MKEYEKKVIRKVQDILDKVEALPGADPEDEREMMRELRDMGAQDIPSVKGFSSSMRQYVWGVLGHRKQKDAEEMVFVTTDRWLIENAETLKQKYNVYPISPEQSVVLIQRQKSKSEEIRIVTTPKQQQDYHGEF